MALSFCNGQQRGLSTPCWHVWAVCVTPCSTFGCTPCILYNCIFLVSLSLPLSLSPLPLLSSPLLSSVAAVAALPYCKTAFKRNLLMRWCARRTRAIAHHIAWSMPSLVILTYFDHFDCVHLCVQVLVHLCTCAQALQSMQDLGQCLRYLEFLIVSPCACHSVQKLTKNFWLIFDYPLGCNWWRGGSMELWMRSGWDGNSGPGLRTIEGCAKTI